MIRRSIMLAFACLPLISFADPAPAATAANNTTANNVLFILDASGSMWERVDGQPKIIAAKRVLNDVLRDLPPGTQMGLMSYGHRRKGDCNDIELIAPVGTANAASLARRVSALSPKGETPLAAALLRSADAFAGTTGPRMIVLVTDGAEECHGDPCAAARQLAASGFDVHINVVGFNLATKQREGVECVAREGHGRYFDAANTAALTAVMNEVKTEVAAAQPAPPPPPPAPAAKTNLLSPKNGGQILTSPSDVWLATNNDKEDTVTWMRTGEEAVYGFKDDRPATFDTFAVYIGAQAGGNPKEIELFAGDEGPTGQFHSIGSCSFQNVKMLRTPYQECKFQAVTARYLKVKLGASFANDSYIAASEFAVYGTLGVASAHPAGANAGPAPGALDLLSAKNGGAILTSPSDVWLATVDGEDATKTWLRTGEEAVYGFRDDRPATFNSFAVFIGASAGGNPKEIELLAGDNGPTGQFRSIATCTFQNVKLTRSPYQQCSFAATTAKYIKVKLGQSFAGDSYIAATEFQLTGQLAAAGAAPAAPHAAPAAAAGQIDLLFAKNGGAILTTPTDVWLATIDGDEGSKTWMRTGEEAVYAFKDERAATFDTFAVFIGASAGGNPKTIELLISDSGPTGQFRQAATCTFVNVKLTKSPYQECKFAAVTAKYLKVKLGQSFANDSYIAASEFRLMGRLAP